MLDFIASRPRTGSDRPLHPLDRHRFEGVCTRQSCTRRSERSLCVVPRPPKPSAASRSGGKHVVVDRAHEQEPILSTCCRSNLSIAAVRQWRYTPTLLNNVPVPVVMSVTVNFTLQ